MKAIEDMSSKIILEINPLYGEITSLLHTHFPTNCEIYCLGGWDEKKIDTDTVSPRFVRELDEFPLYPTFVRNLWEKKSHTFPIKTDLRSALEALIDGGKVVDFVFMNCRKPVMFDIGESVEVILDMLPLCPIIGDNFPQIGDEIRKISAKRLLPFQTHFNNIFWSFYLEGGGGEGYVPDPTKFGAKLSDILENMRREGGGEEKRGETKTEEQDEENDEEKEENDGQSDRKKQRIS